MARPNPKPGDPIAELVDSLLVELGENPRRQGLRATPERVSRALRELTDGYGVRPEDVIALIDKLGELKAKGVLTEDEFAAKKAELLKKLG